MTEPRREHGKAVVRHKVFWAGFWLHEWLYHWLLRGHLGWNPSLGQRICDWYDARIFKDAIESEG